MNFLPCPGIILLLLLLSSLILLVVYFIYLTLMYRYDGSQSEPLFTVGSKAFYDWDLAALIPNAKPLLLYKPIEEPPEYFEAAGTSPLPAYYDVLYNDQLIKSFSILAAIK
ncbi:hypothetical protein OSTOST_20610 [Ostertagia ostertagi]